MKHRTTLYSFALPFIVAIAILTNTLPMPGCKKSDDPKKRFHQIAEAVKDIGGGTRDVIKAVGQAFDKNLITIQQKDRLANILIRVARGGEKGVNALAAIEASGVLELTPEQTIELTKLLDDDIVAPFLEIISELAGLAPNASAAIRAAMISLRTAVLLLASRVGRNDIQQRIDQLEVTAMSSFPFETLSKEPKANRQILCLSQSSFTAGTCTSNCQLRAESESRMVAR